MSSSASLEYARSQTKQSVLKYQVKIFQSLIEEIKEHKKNIERLETEKDKINYKRKNLMNQNFSAADHLKKTHKRYWFNFEEMKQNLKTERRQLRYKVREMKKMQANLREYLNYSTQK